MIRLFEHNQAAYDAAAWMLSETGRAAVIHPTGTGKSLIAFRFCEEYPEKTVCWLSPSEYIFRMQLENLKAAADGYEPGNIRFFTYARLMNMGEEELAGIRPDLVVCDEFHRAGAQRWQTGVERLRRRYPEVPVLGLSATHIRYLDNRRDMAKELFGGSIASEMTLGEAIVRGILTPPKYVLSAFSYRKDLETYERRVKNARGKAVRDAAERYLEALRRALDKADGLDEVFARHLPDYAGKYLVFCANKEHMDEMIAQSGEWFAKVDPHPHRYSVYALDPEAERAFAEFQRDDSGHLKLLFCIDMLNEGVHVKDLSGVILLRPTVSPIIYQQQIGRAMSAGSGRQTVIFDIVMNIENLSSIGELKEEMRLAAAYYRDLGEPSQIVNERFRVIDELKDCVELFEKLNDTLSASWELMYGHAKAYYEAHGNLDVPFRYRTEDGYSLGSWIFNQRNRRNGAGKGGLTEERIKRLDEVGMIWGSVTDLRWERNFAAAEAYYREHGDLAVPAEYVSREGLALGRWIANLRLWERSGAHAGYLTKERKRRLEEIGMVWDVFGYYWERNYFAACDFYREHGHLRVPAGYVTRDGIRLGAWLGNQRKLRSGAGMRGTPPSADQIKRLDAIGMEWKPRVDLRWDRAYEAAKEYAAGHGSLLVPVGFTDRNGVRLGTWVQRQRTLFRKGKLPEERRKRLDRIGMAWETPDPWIARYETVKRYYEENGAVRLPQNCTVGRFWIGKWLAQQKKAYDGGKLDPEKRKLLEELPMASDSV